MSALSGTAYATFARTRMREARQAVLRHAVCSYTGVCLGCGRPGPCATLLAARRALAHHTHKATNQRAHTYGQRQLPMMTGDVSTSLPTDELRAACLAVESAVDRADRHLAGVGHPLPRAGLARWGGALTDAWQALGLVYSGISEARKLPGATPATIQDVLDGLTAARADAERAATAAGHIRRQLAAAEDRLRRTSSDAAARVAADRWRTAGARLDLVAARLAIGARAIDRYAHALAGTTPAPRPRPTTPRISIDQLAAGAGTAGAVLLTVHPWTGWRGLLARVRRERQLDQERQHPW